MAAVPLGLWYLTMLPPGTQPFLGLVISIAAGTLMLPGYWAAVRKPGSRLEPWVWTASAVGNGLFLYGLYRGSVPLAAALTFAWPVFVLAASLWLLWSSKATPDSEGR